MVQLTPREKVVVDHMVNGATTKQIASLTGLTYSTVCTYLKRIYAKTGVHTAVELVVYMRQHESAPLAERLRRDVASAKERDHVGVTIPLDLATSILAFLQHGDASSVLDVAMANLERA